MAAKLIDGKKIAQSLREKVAREAAALQQSTGVVAHLAAVLIGDDPASQVYVRNKKRACENAGLKSTVHHLPATTRSDDLLGLIQTLNGDSTVHGILVQLPLPAGLDERQVQLAIAPEKDVDALHPFNVGLIAEGHPRFLPCTPAGVQQLLLFEKVPTVGAHVVIVGRSNLVGKPLALILSQKAEGANATVTLCHSRTRDLASHVRQADIVVAAIGSPAVITGDMIQPGATVIDVGINRLPDGRLVGDVDFESASQIAGAITPVPGGVGPMTIAMLLANTLAAARNN